MNVTTTINRTSFASALMDGTALYLDGVAEIGSARADLFARAKKRLTDALSHSHHDASVEVEMAKAMIAKITEFESRGLHV